ncbi:hypothetical protein [Bacillus mycoides]|uniref:hypothetical protein n=1 Tax=Bacillus mycoides TaxID=1405 RepID=UPI0005957621|nr:hypothetical protein [Bacillus mycoides]
MKKTINCSYREKDTLEMKMMPNGNVALMAKANDTYRTTFVNPTVLLGVLKSNLEKGTASGDIKCLVDKHNYYMKIRRQSDSKSIRVEIYGAGDYAIIILNEAKAEEAMQFLRNVRGYFEEMAVK